MSQLLRSRKFVIVVVYLVAQAIVAFAPDNIDAKVEKYAPIAAVVVAVGIAGITLEDSVKAWAARPGSVEEAVQSAFDEIKGVLFPAQATLPPNASGTVSTTPPQDVFRDGLA